MNRPKVGVAAIVVKESRVLLTRRKGAHGAGSWAVPGGHLEFGETPEACAARETLEEVGIHIANLRFRAITNDIFEAEGRHYITIWMQGDYLSGEAHIAADDEVAAVGWFAWDALPSPLFIPLENLLAGKGYTGR